MAQDGFWLIDKEKDWTSFDVCARMRKILNIKKVGHTGTLDPFATGLLVVATGKCTKLIPFLEKEKKTYRTKIILGKTSETLDPESEIKDCKYDRKPSKAEIEKVIKEDFLGEINQIPPQFSAIKINGKKACDIARKGQKVDLKSRKTEVFRMDILSYKFPELELEMEVSAGFYVRSLARDLGKILAGGGLCQELRRIRVGELDIKDAQQLEQITEAIDPKFILTSITHRDIPGGRVQDFIAGRVFPFSGVEKEKILVLVGGNSVGIGEITCGNLQPRIVL
ncbi:tRNA pseudouridine(55) synthase TruB [Candidatus Gracilibacteria bacterium]|nr:tRNA pseudouridine(55) synthase TruB [Candidatus Gracilibacteria bacterium]